VRGRGQEAGGKVRFGARRGRAERSALGVWQCQGKEERDEEPTRARLFPCAPAC